MPQHHIRRTLRIPAALAGLAAAGFVVLAWYPALTPIDPPPPTQFSAGKVRHGAELAAIGGCASCHTADDIDTGQIVNSDGVRNQIEGGILQSLSWAL